MKVKDVIEQRKSVKRYSSSKPDWRKILRALDSMRFAPRAGGLSHIKIILISDPEKIAAVAPHTHQDFVATAPYLVAIVSDEASFVKSYGKRGEKYSQQQVGASIQNFFLSATEQKLATCWIGYFDDAAIKSVLKVPEHLSLEALFTVGLETKVKTPLSKKIDFDHMIFFDYFGNKVMDARAKVNWRNM